MTKSTRLISFDTLKGLGIAFIVLGHIIGAGCHLAQGNAQTFCEAGYKYLYAFHVPLFFFIAGLTFKSQTWATFFRKKSLRLLLPYLFFGICSIVLYFMIASLINGHLTGTATTAYYEDKIAAPTIGKQLLNLLLGGYWRHGFVANAVLWFIPVLFAVEFFMQGVSRCHMRPSLWLICALGGMVLWFFIRSDIHGLPFGLWGIVAYSPWVIGGMLYRQNVSFDLKRIPWALLFPLGILLIVCTVLNPWQYFPKTLWQYLLTVVLTLGNIGWWLVFSTKISSRGLAFWGTTSLGIMFMHKFPVLFFQHVCIPIRFLFTQGLLMAIVGTLLVFTLTMLCCWIGIWILRRFAPWTIGERQRRG